MKRICLECSEYLVGRSDKKFCDDQCRSSYHNRIHHKSASALKPVNAILRKNHSILRLLCINGTFQLKRDDLLRLGFNPEYHTHEYRAPQGEVWYFCYDYGFMENKENLVVLMSQKNT